ncbi:MAG: hypothetical protein IJW22_01630 [Clostridia bacterium]|nr:hypothetical protein [Clostridia bacterium]
MYQENRKTQLWHEKIVQENMKKQLSMGGVLALIGLILGGMTALLTWGIGSSMSGNGLFAVVLAIVMLVLFWGADIIMFVGAGILLCQGIYLLQGKYVIEVDTVELLELKSEYERRRNPLGRGYHRVLVTNQYVHFAKYGRYKSDRTLRQGQECYLLVVLTKKPQILAFWECEEYEIKGL